jgi:hypothetical protein
VLTIVMPWLVVLSSSELNLSIDKMSPGRVYEEATDRYLNSHAKSNDQRSASASAKPFLSFSARYIAAPVQRPLLVHDPVPLVFEERANLLQGVVSTPLQIRLRVPNPISRTVLALLQFPLNVFLRIQYSSLGLVDCLMRFFRDIAAFLLGQSRGVEGHGPVAVVATAQARAEEYLLDGVGHVVFEHVDG